MTVLQVLDINRSLEFYEKLQFTAIGKWGDPYGFAIVQRGAVTFGLERVDQIGDPGNTWSAYVYVDDVETTYKEFQNTNVKIGRVLMDRMYGCRDFELSDPDGHRICFGQDMDPVHGPGLAQIEKQEEMKPNGR